MTSATRLAANGADISFALIAIASKVSRSVFFLRNQLTHPHLIHFAERFLLPLHRQGISAFKIFLLIFMLKWHENRWRTYAANSHTVKAPERQITTSSPRISFCHIINKFCNFDRICMLTIKCGHTFNQNLLPT